MPIPVRYKQKDAFLRGESNNSTMITKGERYREIGPGSRCLGVESTMSKAEVTLLQGRRLIAKMASLLVVAPSAQTAAFAPRPQTTISIQRGKGTVELPAYTAAAVEL